MALVKFKLRHMTCASFVPKASLQTVPQVSLYITSTRPAKLESDGREAIRRIGILVGFARNVRTCSCQYMQAVVNLLVAFVRKNNGCVREPM